MNSFHKDDQYTATGRNALLGGLICYSCQRHTRLWYDKTLWANWPQRTPGHFRIQWDKTVLEDAHPIYVLKTGELSIGCSCCSTEFLVSIMRDLESNSDANLIPFGEGVAFEYSGKRMECSQCGSEEFCNPQNSEQAAAP